MQKTRRQLTPQGLLIKNRLMELNMTQKDLAVRLQMRNGYLKRKAVRNEIHG